MRERERQTDREKWERKPERNKKPKIRAREF
jgi:hypothetical protein